MKERSFWIILGLIGLSFILNSFYSQSKQLKEPIFLDHYIQTRMDDHNWIDFYYLTNKKDNSQISYIKMGDLMGYVHNDPFTFGSSVSNIDTYPHQALRKISVQLSSLDFGYEEFTFNEMEVFFTNGDKMTASIGEFIVLPTDYLTREMPSALQQPSVGSSNDGNSWYSFLATESLIIEGVLFPFKERIADQFTFTITGSSNQREKTLDALEFPIHLDKDEQLNFRMKLRDASFTNPMNFLFQLAGKTEKGKTFINYGGYHLSPYLTKDDVNKIIREKTGRNSIE